MLGGVMRLPLVLLLVLVNLAVESLAGEGLTFTGSWDGPDNDASAFSLDLVQTGKRIKGYHSSIAHRGKRIDAILPNEGPPSITGTVIDNVAYVRFRSGYDESGKGEATLKLHGNKLEWKITKSSGAHYFPTSLTLQRMKRRSAKAPDQALSRTLIGASFALPQSSITVSGKQSI